MDKERKIKTVPKKEILKYLYPLTSSCRALIAPVLRVRILWIRNRVTGKFRTSSLQISHVLFPLMLNHLMAQSLCAKASSPLQLHSIFSVSPPSHNSTKQILQTASSSGISSPALSSSEPSNKHH